MFKIWDFFVSRRLLEPVLESSDFKESCKRLLTKSDKLRF